MRIVDVIYDYAATLSSTEIPSREPERRQVYGRFNGQCVIVSDTKRTVMDIHIILGTV